ncbi:MAG: MFS transporter, partial [Verrucomicrobiae bacterium]|nr:MFS transporter [Verrucomicrobiae bacterium]
MDNANSNKPQLGELARNGNYVRLFCAQIIGALGDRLHQMALLNFVIAVTGTSHSVKHIADITFWGIFPAVVFGPIAMACMDRWPWKKTMVVSTLLRALLAVMMPQILLAWPDVHTVWSTAFLLGTFAAVFGPARLALMPNLVPARNLTTANAVSSQVGTVATILGILLGGFLVHHLGSVYGDTAGRSYAFYADAVCFGISLALILLLRPQSARKKPVHHESHWLSDFRVGIRYVRRHSDIAFTIALFGFLMLVSGLVYGCLFQYTIDLLKYSEDKIGALFAV